MRSARIFSLAVLAGWVGPWGPIGHAAPQMVRDSAPAERRVPVGTGSISGAVVAANTGRPVRGVRIDLNGTAGGKATLAPPWTAASAGLAGPTPMSRGGAIPLARMTVTDSSGRFSIEKLPAGEYRLMASRSQFLPTTYGQRKPGGQGTPIVLGDGQTLTVSVPLTRGGAITGAVTTEDGDPLTMAQVAAWRFVMTSGVRRLQQTSGGMTDDRGIYRLYGLAPGDYLVAATPNTFDGIMAEQVLADTAAIYQAISQGAVRPPTGPGLPSTVTIPQRSFGRGDQPPGFLPTFAPSARQPAGGTVVHVTGGDEHADVDVQVQLVHASVIAGTVTPALDPGVAVQITLTGDSAFEIGSGSARTDPNGHFTLRNVEPGEYVVSAQTVAVFPQMTIINGVPSTQQAPPPKLSDTQKLWARVPVTVDGEATVDVTLALRPGRSISGRVVYEMTRPEMLGRGQGNVFLTSAPTGQPILLPQATPAVVDPAGRFTLTGVAPGRYTLRASAGFTKSAVVNGVDTLDVPLEVTGEADVSDAVVTVTDVYSEVSGRLTDAAGQPARDYTIVAASADARYWTPGSRRIQTGHTDADGRYVIRGLPPGAYLLAAVTDLEPGGQFDPAFLKTMAGASMPIALAEGGKLVQDLRVGR